MCAMKLAARDVRHAGRRHGARLERQHVLHDRQVVDREIPDDVHVVLKQAEVHAHGIVVIQLAQLARRHERRDLAHGPRIHERVVDHQHEPPPLGLLDEPPALLARQGERFLNQHVLPRLQRRHREIEVRRHRGRDRHRVDRRVLNQIRGVAGGADAGIARGRRRHAVRQEVARADQPGT
jgi:hypothetical protein